LSKALHSLSWNQAIVVPRTVDAAGTILAIDGRKLLWTHAHWLAVLKAYPYGLSYGSHDDEKLKELDTDIRRLIGRGAEELIHVRADWFVATATRPPLYHTLLYDDYLPELRKRKTDAADPANPKRMTARDLETYLNVDVEANLLASDPPARRAGFARSGVSGQNRLIERHPLKAPGAYWKSYDFKASTWEANLQQFPLGPRFAKNKFNDLAFEHAGGEIIFNLPNGLQGYLLVNGKDERIDAGPIEVVSDVLKTSGTPVIVNGLSCMACHKNGMIEPPKDDVRDGKGVFGAARQRVRQLYPEAAEMKQLLQDDGDRFLGGLEKAVGRFLRAGADKDRPARELPEPVGEVARKYILEDLELETVACELFVEDAARLRKRIEDSADLRKLGLGALAQKGGTVKRGAWESVRGTSQMQQAARELGYTPYP
jgi:serine/threonine-protein kinase